MDFEEIPYPVKLYRDRYKNEHARNTDEAFEQLVKQSGVDIEANTVLSADIRKHRKELESIRAVLGRWQFLKNFLALLLFICIIGLTLFIFQVCGSSLVDFQIPTACGAAFAGIALIAIWLIFSPLKRKIRDLQSSADEKQNELLEKIERAWEQMAPLNCLFQWDTITKIAMKTLPIIKIDQYFSESRMENLRSHFQWNPVSDNTHSIICCQSGTMNGNPWILAEDFQQYWGTATYTGSITIKWEERVTYTDSNGRTQSRWQTRYQTLTATVEKPKPFYRTKKYLVYGNEAAPDLKFTREPNSLSSSGRGFFGRRKLKGAIHALEKKSRDLDDPFTIMDNREFDACFHAVDRNNEQQFRVLFTPLAQQEMLNLLRDNEQGFGDDFVFRKDKMINTLSSDHLSGFDFSASPHLFMNYDFSEIRKVFCNYSNDFFRNFYFSMAPVLCIPLYQEYRNYQDIYHGVIDSGEASSFEYESFANAMKKELFQPAGAATSSILKTRVLDGDGSAVNLAVCAHAFRTEDRVDIVSKFGGDGKSHNIPVHWKEYLPVTKETGMAVCKTGTSDHLEFEKKSRNKEWQELFTRWNAIPETLSFRRNLAAFIRQE